MYLFFVFFHALFQNENIIYNMECQQIHLHTINPTPRLLRITVFICQKQDHSVCKQILHELDDTYLLAFSLLSAASALTTNTLAPPTLTPTAPD